MASQIDVATMQVLAGSKFFMSHPGDSSLTELYAGPSRCQTNLAPTVNFRGQFRVTSDNKGFPGKTTFNVSSSSLYDIPMVTCRLPAAMIAKLPATPGANNGPMHPKGLGWGYKLIKNISITLSNSQIQQNVLSGKAIIDILFNQTRGKKDLRRRIFELGGDPNIYSGSTGEKGEFILFLPYLTNHVLKSAMFPQDGSVMAGPLVIQIEWNDYAYAFFAGPDDAGALGINQVFDKLEFSFLSTNLQSAPFQVKTQMIMNPSLVLANPAKYYNEYPISDTFTNANGNTIKQVNLTSAPAGMLEGIILSYQPVGIPTTAGNKNGDTTVGVALPTLEFTSVKLTFGGQNLIDWQSTNEIEAYYAHEYEEDNTFEWVSKIKNNTDTGLMGTYFIHPLVLPLGYNPAQQFCSTLIENNPNYGGSQLQLTFTVAAPKVATGAAGKYPDTLPVYASAAQTIPDGAPCELRVMYVVPALLQQQGGTSDLQF